MTALLLILVFLLFQKHIAAALKNKGLLQCADKPFTSHNSHIVLLFLLIYKKALFHQDRHS